MRINIIAPLSKSRSETVHSEGRTPKTLQFSIVIDTVPPTYLSSDHDPLFTCHRWTATLRILGVKEVKTVPFVPLSHPFVERLVGTVRREYLDQVPFWNARDLERKLDLFKVYYNRQRVHQGLEGQVPSPEAVREDQPAARLDDYRWKSCCRGLFQLPMAARIGIRTPHVATLHAANRGSPTAAGSTQTAFVGAAVTENLDLDDSPTPFPSGTL